MPRIVFLSTSSIDNASPRGRWLPMAQALVNCGCEPHLVLLHPDFAGLPAEQRLQVRDGVTVRHVAQMHVHGTIGAPQYYGPAALLKVTARATRALLRATMALKPDVIHVCKPQPMNGLAALIAQRRLGCRLFVDCDDYEAAVNHFGSAWQRALVRRVEDALPGRADGVTVNTRFLYDRCRALGVPAARLTHIPNGLNPTFEAGVLPRAHDGRTVLYAGHMSRASHGVDLLLQAFALLRQSRPDVQLLLAGGGVDLEHFKALAGGLGLADAAQFLGPVPAVMVHALYAQATLSVDPVRDQPGERARSPLKIVESMASGVPVATSDVGDRASMLPRGAPLCAPDSAPALAGLMGTLLDPEFNQTLGELGRASARALNTRALGARWAAAYGSGNVSARRAP